MFNEKDIQQVKGKGLSIFQVEEQLEHLRNGFPNLKISAAATVGNGILCLDENERQSYTSKWQAYRDKGHKIVKFVPASGAASRMFKDLFAFLDADYEIPTTDFEKYFFDNVRSFAFRKELCRACKDSVQSNVCGLLENGQYKAIVKSLLSKEGMNYGSLPKGLLLFHFYEDGPRTAMEEHLVEAALYAVSNGKAHVHFTVSEEHLSLFKARVEEVLYKYEEKYNTKIDVTFSQQKSSTDTVAVNEDGTPFRNEDGSLLFRPGGHGALIQNINETDADVLFIKNIDNVVPDRLKNDTIEYKQVLAGLLVLLQNKVFEYLNLLDNNDIDRDKLDEILLFLEKNLYCYNAKAEMYSNDELRKYLHSKLNRPIRVCGMVKNEGEPGGGPFLVYNTDGTISLQILESSQLGDIDGKEALNVATHFNPVDLVCGIKNYKGEKLSLADYVDEKTGFISSKSKNGRELKALELPGLWNGAMSDWNTIFVEVPLSTFNPVKTINDLLREEHQ